MTVINIGRINQLFRKFSPSLSLSLFLSTKTAKFYITRSNASDKRKHYPRFSTIYTLVWIHNKIGVRPCDILCPFHFSFPSPCPIPGPLFYPIITPMRKSAPPFFCPKYITLSIYLYTHSQRRTQKKISIIPPPPPSKKKVLKVKSSSPPDSTHLPPQVTYSFFPLSADLPPSSSTPHHYHHSPLLPQQSE